MRKVMSQPLRVENPEHWSFVTSRTVRSELWFVNSKSLEERILNYLARYREVYSVELYAFVLMGNHYHLIARFPKGNRAAFFRDFNARVAEGVRLHVPEFERGPVFERRYSEQALLRPADLKDYFFYCALQPIKAGLAANLSEYPSYNSFDDAISGRKKQRKYVDWDRFTYAKLRNPQANIADFTTYHSLEFSRIPGMEGVSPREYRKELASEYSQLRQNIIQERAALGLGFLGKQKLQEISSGSKPQSTKRSARTSKRPLILTRCLETKKIFLAWYFGVLDSFKKASAAFRKGTLLAEFPPGTYRPPLCVVPNQG